MLFSSSRHASMYVQYSPAQPLSQGGKVASSVTQWRTITSNRKETPETIATPAIPPDLAVSNRSKVTAQHPPIHQRSSNPANATLAKHSKPHFHALNKIKIASGVLLEKSTPSCLPSRNVVLVATLVLQFCTVRSHLHFQWPFHAIVPSGHHDQFHGPSPLPDCES